MFYDPKEVPIPSFLPDTPETREELAHYYQSVSRIDQGVERLVEILKEADLYDKTMIVFTSDHGMAFAGGKTPFMKEVYGYLLWFVIPTRKKGGS